MLLPATLLRYLEEHILRDEVVQIAPVSGGDINQAFCLRGKYRNQWFLKTNPRPHSALMFRREAQGLALLGASGVIRTPRVFGYGEDQAGNAFLLLEFVESARSTPLFWERFGRQLAALHTQTSAFFGFAHDNFIGRLPQSNRRCETWPEFYADERLRPQMRMAREQGLLDKAAEQQLERLCQHLGEICPNEPPALIHGDLWSGNFLSDARGEPVLIDPAAAYAHREMDIAMSRLFGGFDARFYAAYQESWPLAPGFEARIEVYQLYYLLVHVNLFGRSYEGSVRRILQDWS